ncbi:MAG TPA: restriction endonuclease FokI C-terminal domain-containing protein [Leptospiraceae bacterium]|nr:restriction endonuclease FokI C-terminal domain-containing protein [Leptospiraceae bacterium]
MNFAKDLADWSDVTTLIGRVGSRVQTTAQQSPQAADLIPAVLHGFQKLSQTDGALFEPAVIFALQFLGFYVDDSLGQGSGRNPDGIAYSPANHFALLFDAKSRKDGYSIGTDDRQFREYINARKSKLSSMGYTSISFLVVSSFFNGNNRTSLDRILGETSVPVVLLTAKDLETLIQIRSRCSGAFDLADLIPLLRTPGEVPSAAIDSFATSVQRHYDAVIGRAHGA